MRRILVLSAVLFGLPLSVFACLWDRDTPAEEANGLPEVVAVLTGRFPRNPPLYYQMRLDRVSAHLQSHPEDLAAYDDAGVSCDRLGRGDEAVGWMEKKRAEIDKLAPENPDRREHLYRYHANLGTFLAHRWIKQGADRARIDEVKAARDEIAKALEINPDAHFGREKYQLMVLEWLTDPPKADESQYIPNFLELVPSWQGDSIDPEEAQEIVQGLAGLIVLGNAWESVDVFNALDLALQRDSLGFENKPFGGRTSLAYFAWLRCKELIEAGKGSMLPDAPRGDALLAKLLHGEMLNASDTLDPAYAKLRAEAEAWQTARTQFMTARLEAGRHPDDDPNFWQGYIESPPPPLPAISPKDTFDFAMKRRIRIAWMILIGVAGLLVAGLIALRRAKARKAAAIKACRRPGAEGLSSARRGG